MAFSETGRGKPHQRRRGGKRNPPAAIAVRLRPQTLEEQRQFMAAFRLFLGELVRQVLERQKVVI